MKLNIPRREPRKLRANKTKQLVERRFSCRRCRKSFTKLVPRVGKKAFHLYCGPTCYRGEVAHLELHRADVTQIAADHRQFKRRARRASWKPDHVHDDLTSAR